MLHGISEHPATQTWAFKGGTCLKKCFFEPFRFSEDLDFTVVRLIEIIGEASTALSGELKEEYCNIEWSVLKGIQTSSNHHSAWAYSIDTTGLFPELDKAFSRWPLAFSF